MHDRVGVEKEGECAGYSVLHGKVRNLAFSLLDAKKDYN